MIAEEKDYADNKIIYHLNIDEREKDVLMHLNSLKTISANRVIKYTNLVGALFIFSISVYSYSIHISFAWIFFLLSIGFAVLGLNTEKFQRAFMKSAINKKNQQINSKEEFLFSKEGVDITTELGTKHNYWNSFAGRGEIENYIYLIRKDQKVILVNKDELSEDDLMMFQSFIHDIEMDQIEKKNKTSFGIKALVVATMITVIVSIIYIGIKIGYHLSQGQIFRLWFIRTVPIILLLTLQCLNLIWICVLSRMVKENKQKSLLKRILLWVAGLIVVMAMALGIFVHMLNDDSEHYIGDGTVIIESPVWLDKTSFALYREENFLVLQYLRDADGIEDVDISITQKEYIRKKREELEKYSGHQHENQEESTKNDVTTIDEEAAEKSKKIEEGYLKVYETYIKETDGQYRQDYNAKGYSYIVTYDDKTQIRYLMYDRDDDHGTKAQYVYFQNKKNPDGSWSSMNSEILDMYQYDYESKEVKDLEKTSW